MTPKLDLGSIMGPKGFLESKVRLSGLGCKAAGCRCKVRWSRCKVLLCVVCSLLAAATARCSCKVLLHGGGVKVQCELWSVGACPTARLCSECCGCCWQSVKLGCRCRCCCRVLLQGAAVSVQARRCRVLLRRACCHVLFGWWLVWRL